VARGARGERLNHQVVSFKSSADTPAMPGMLRKSTAFLPRYQKFESISLQRRVHKPSVPQRLSPSRLGARARDPSTLPALVMPPRLGDSFERAGRRPVYSRVNSIG